MPFSLVYYVHKQHQYRNIKSVKDDYNRRYAGKVFAVFITTQREVPESASPLVSYEMISWTLNNYLTSTLPLNLEVPIGLVSPAVKMMYEECEHCCRSKRRKKADFFL